MVVGGGVGVGSSAESELQPARRPTPKKTAAKDAETRAMLLRRSEVMPQGYVAEVVFSVTSPRERLGRRLIPDSSQAAPRRKPSGSGHSRHMSISRLIAAMVAVLTSLGLALSLAAAPAQASSESDLRDKVHARLAVFVEDAVDDGFYTETQRDYILRAISSSSPDSLSARSERRVKGAFWRIITEVGEVSQSQAKNRLERGWTLERIAGDDAEKVRDRLRDWLVNPVIRNIMEGQISWSEAAGLLSDTRTAVNRLMAQPGGDRDVILVRKSQEKVTTGQLATMQTSKRLQ